VLSKGGVQTLREDDWKSLHEVAAQVSEEFPDVIVSEDASVVVSSYGSPCSRVTGLGKATMSCSSYFRHSAESLPARRSTFHRITEPRLPSGALTTGSKGADTVSLAILYTNHDNCPHIASKALNITTSELSPSPRFTHLPPFSP
jgi:hypothetical protein